MLRTAERWRKVPQVTVVFWIVKLLTTAQGEATSDYAVHRFNPVAAVLVGGAGLVVALLLQLSMRRYLAPVYWLAVVMVAITGTMAADVIHIGLGVPYAVSAAGFALSLAVIFATWYRIEGTLSIHSIVSLPRELFYWATVLATFALGTAVGDLTAYTLHLGFLASGLLFAVVFAIPVIVHATGRVSPVLTFWFAYIITRPLGASFADWMGVPHALGGLDLGRGSVSIALTLLIVALVAYLAISRMDVEAAPADAARLDSRTIGARSQGG